MGRVVLGVMFIVVACGKSEPAPSDDWAVDTAAKTAAAPADTGSATISGVVRFAGTPPVNPTIDMSGAPGCEAMYPGGFPTDFRITVNGGMLSDVFVYIKSGLPEGREYPVPGSLPFFDLHECRIRPQILGVVAGQTFEIKNSDPVQHHFVAIPKRNRGFADVLRQGATATHRFPTPELMIPVQCEDHAWMRGYVGVMKHPFFTTTGSDGAFRLTGLPAGTYEVEVWHPRLGSRTARIQVPVSGTATTVFTYSGASQS